MSRFCIYKQAYNGHKRKKLFNDVNDYGEEWNVDDIIGIGIELNKDKENESKTVMKCNFYLNGKDMGIAFDNISISGKIYPAFSIHKGINTYTYNLLLSVLI